VVFWKVAMTRGVHNNRRQPGLWLGRAGCAVHYLARPLSCTQSHSKAKAAWESGAVVIFKRVAMIRASLRGLGDGQGGSGGGCPLPGPSAFMYAISLQS